MVGNPDDRRKNGVRTANKGLYWVCIEGMRYCQYRDLGAL